MNIPIGETDEFWYRDDHVVIDVRERQEHVVSDIPCTADVINVPVTEVIQFIHDHQTLKERDIICVAVRETAALLLMFYSAMDSNERQLWEGLLF